MESAPGLQPGKLIALEGLDGVGKTTQARLLARHLTDLGLRVLLTREPTEGFFGCQIRRLIHHGRQGLPPVAELALFLADRREHVREVIAPNLADGKMVITDRYYHSSMAYQGALGLDPWEIERLHADFAPRPDLVIILELPLAAIVQRLQERRGPRSLSFENSDYLGRVAAIFELFQAANIVRVDGLGAESEVHSRILTVCNRFFHLPESTGPLSKKLHFREP